MGIPPYFSISSITRGAQKPPWHRPMPARVRRLTPSTVGLPSVRSMAWAISASVTVSHRQMMRP